MTENIVGMALIRRNECRKSVCRIICYFLFFLLNICALPSYFTLWLREYKQRYNQWKSQTAFQQKGHGFSPNWTLQYSSQLAMFYARAKHTFFTPGSEYELNLSSSLLAPFHQPDMPPYPDPDMLKPVAAETFQTLEESLRRFVHAQFNNAGNNRVLCGVIAGIFFSLLGTLPPIAYNLANGGPRWIRLSALPGLWIGLTILLASLNGICMGVYVFGDLRQLRKFELLRPSISKPQPLPAFKRPSISSRPLSTNSILPIQHLSKRPTTSRYNHDHHHHNTHNLHQPKRASSVLSNTSRISVSTSHTVSDDCNIQISPAYYDGDTIDGPASITCSYQPDWDYHFPPHGMESDGSSPLESSFTSTASFILPFESSDDGEDYGAERQDRSAHLRPYKPPFDFDSLPRRPNHKATTTPRPHSHLPDHENYRDPTPATPLPAMFRNPTSFVQHSSIPPETSEPRGFLERMQEKCNIPKWRLQTGFLESEESISKKISLERPMHAYTHRRRVAEEFTHAFSSPSNLVLEKHIPKSPELSASSSAISPPTPRARLSSNIPSTESKDKDKKDGDNLEDMETKVRKRFRLINAVPAFAVPLTRILSPVIVRAQWEIVVRSAIIAFLISWVVIGSFLAVPVIMR
jgi:hypothetical protein